MNLSLDTLFRSFIFKKIIRSLYLCLASIIIIHFVVVQLVSCIWLSVTPWTPAHQTSLFFTISQCLLRFMFIELVILSNHLILCSPLLLLPSVFPSITVFPNELVFHIKWPEYWNFSFSISLFNEYSGLTSFRIDWFDLLAVQETLKSLL